MLSRPRRRLLAAGATLVLAGAGLLASAPPALAAQALTAHFTAADRGSWWLGEYEVRNGSAAAVTGWTLEFDLQSGQTVGTAYHGVVTQSGSHVTVKNAHYNGTVPANGSTYPYSFQFIGGGTTTPPSNCKINGNPCEGGPSDTPPTAPVLSSPAKTSSTVDLSWTASSDDNGVTGYEVYRAGTLVTTVTGLTYTVTGLTPDTSYTFTVRAVDTASQKSPDSNAVTVRTDPGSVDNPPTAPTLSVLATGTYTVDLGWTAASDDKGVTGYEVYRAGTLVTTVSGLSYRVTGLTANTSYTFTVRAVDTVGQKSPHSNTVTARTQPDTGVDFPPSAPGNLRRTGTTATTLSIAWDASTDDRGVIGYAIYVNGTQAGSSTGLTATIQGLEPRTTYQVSVRARDTIGKLGDAAGPIAITTGDSDTDTQPPTAPTNLRATATTINSVSLAWNASTDNVAVTGYEVLRTGVPAVPSTATSVTISGLQPRTSYTFRVVALDAAGNRSPESAQLTVTTPEQPSNHAACRPDGVQATGTLNTPYCNVYDTDGREKMGADHPRRNIGYFASWRNGANNQPKFLVPDIPFSKLTHINYAFAHVDRDNKVSVGPTSATNPATGMEWPGVPGAEMDPEYSYKGHFNLLNKYKKTNPNLKTLISIGGWAETGGYIDPSGVRQASGGFYTMAETQAKINTFADSVVAFLRQYGFNGADIDYEYATSANYAGNPDDYTFSQARRATLVTQYVALMKTLREKLDAASAADGKYYMLTAAVSASGWLLRGNEWYQVTQYLDYANLMTYDLHGAWNAFVGPNAALYDDGNDAELKHWNVYGTYGGLGYLNTDWAYHYFRATMPPGRINLGVPFYTRGWQGVTGGTNGMWGNAPLPDQTKCPPGTGSSVGSTVPCGWGAEGIDNLWHDTGVAGDEQFSGSNPMWHAKNLENGKQGSYLTEYGLDPVNNPKHKLTGTYTRNYQGTQKSPWLWNATKKVFLSTEDEQSIADKAQYVVDKGIGGLMFWELSGDYKYYPERNGGQGEYFFGDTLTSLIYEKFKTAAPYQNLKTTRALPAAVANVGVSVRGFAVGDANYPITPYLRITNNTGATIPASAVLEFDFGTQTMVGMTNQSGWQISTTAGHTGNNVGGLKGDFHHARLTIPQAINNGATAEVQLRYDLPISTPANFTLTYGGSSYRLSADCPRTP